MPLHFFVAKTDPPSRHRFTALAYVVDPDPLRGAVEAELVVFADDDGQDPAHLRLQVPGAYDLKKILTAFVRDQVLSWVEGDRDVIVETGAEEHIAQLWALRRASKGMDAIDAEGEAAAELNALLQQVRSRGRVSSR